MKIGILGASGFLGGALADSLADQGHEIIGFALNPPLTQQNHVSYFAVSDLSAETHPSQFGLDAVINVAARRSTRAHPLSDEEVRKYTFEIPRDFILRTASPHTLVINASTYIQNFQGMAGRTVDSYGAAKEELSIFLSSIAKKDSFKTLDLYLFTIFGPGDKPSHLVPLLLNAAKSNEPISLSPGHQLMNLIYVDDVVRNISNTLLLPNLEPYQKHFVWNNEYFSVRQLVEVMETVAGVRIPCEWGGRDYVGHEMLEVWPIPMTQIPNFDARISLEEGIARLWARFKMK